MIWGMLYAVAFCFNLGFGGVIICDKDHEKRVNKEFLNMDINTEIETEELRKVLEKSKVLVDGRINVMAYKNEIKKQDLIKKYDQIKEKMLEEYPSDYSKLDYNTSISEEELEKVKGKVKKLVK